jgi:hypothetical protein
VCSGAGWHDLDADEGAHRQVRHLEQLVVHGLGGADQAVQYGLVKNYLEVRRVRPVEDALARQPGVDELVDCFAWRPTRCTQPHRA